MNILTVSQSYKGGGAARVAWNLYDGYKKQGHNSWIAVGHKKSFEQAKRDSDAFFVDSDSLRDSSARFSIKLGEGLSPIVQKHPKLSKLQKLISFAGQPARLAEILRGHEDFDFPGTKHFFENFPYKINIIQCHNLHRDYFDLRILPWLSKKFPVMLTLHDAWLLGGHCAHSFECEKWRNGCGKCPHLKTYISLAQDGSDFNWRRKKEIYAQSCYYVNTPCKWMMDKVGGSILNSGAIEKRIIPYGIDLETYYPGDQAKARDNLKIPQDSKVMLFVGNLTKSNLWKDYATLEKALQLLDTRSIAKEKKIILICLGEEQPKIKIGSVEIWFSGFIKDISIVRQYYHAADIYAHPAKVDTFPNTVLEALACGKPVVASAVGGIPEQVEDGLTGFLSGLGDYQTMAEHLEKLLLDDKLRSVFGGNAAVLAKKKFDIKRYVSDNLNWFQEIISKK